MPVKTHKYSNGDVTVVWQPEMCIHSTICWKGLHEVFDPKKRPWVNMEGSATERIVEQVKQCPSGALSYFINAGDNTKATTVPPPQEQNSFSIQVKANGPLLVKTDCTVLHPDGRQEIRKGVTALCRCGASANKPYCDGSHNKINFQG